MRPRHAVLLTALALAAPARAQQFRLAPGAIPGPPQWTSGIECADVDNDGDADAFLAHGGGWSAATAVRYPHTLLVNELAATGAFRFVDESAGRLGAQVSCAKRVITGDIQGDGWVDALYCNCFDGEPPGLYVNRGAAQPGAFTFEGRERGLTAALSSYAGQFGDLDGDGDLDLVLGDSTTYWDPVLGGEPQRVGQPRLYLNDGAGAFAEERAPRWNPARGDGAHDVLLADLDGDWDVDVLVSNVSHGKEHHLLLNDGGAFRDEEWRLVPTSAATWEAEAADLDGDADLDLFLLGSEPGAPDTPWAAASGPLRNRLAEAGALRFEEQPAHGADDINEVVLLDHDMDGDLDAFVTALGVPADQVHRNDGGLCFTLDATVLPPGLDPRDPTLDATVADVDGDGDFDYLTAVGEARGADWTNLLFLNDGRPDTLPPVVLREEPLPAQLPPRGPWVLRAQVRDQVQDDGQDWLTARATWRVTDGAGKVHAGEAAGRRVASGLYRFELQDTADGEGVELAVELRFRDAAGNETATATRTAPLDHATR